MTSLHPYLMGHEMLPGLKVCFLIEFLEAFARKKIKSFHI